MFTDPNTLVTALLISNLALVILIIIWLIVIQVRVRRLLKGKNAKTLEDTILNLQKQAEDYKAFKHDSVNYFKNIEQRLRRSIRRVETIRFNPFQGTGSGGNQSFSTAFIDEEGNGVVISSLYSRDRTSIFSKPLSKYKSEYELTDEEKNAIGEAKNKLQQN